MSLKALPPLSLYIHIPWCVKKCPYCDFNSHDINKNNLPPERAYLQKLIEDLHQDLIWVQKRPLCSIFIGGGTPSLMSGDFYQQLLSQIETLIPFEENIEITLEANPGTAEQARFEGYQQAGINRLSLGIQTFHPAHLKKLGRIHNTNEAIMAIKMAQSSGFNRINLDLMYGLPGQTEKEALEDIHHAVEMDTTHISWYQLTIEPNTEFYSRPPSLPEEEALYQIHTAGHHTLKMAGFEQYEVSAWAKQNQYSRHNLNYWQFGDYLGIGAGAYGKISFSDALPLRYHKTRQPDAYLNRIGHFLAGKQTVEHSEIPLEFLMNALRLRQGVDEALFIERTGLPISAIAPQLANARRRKLLLPDRLQATPLGFEHLNSLLDKFL